MKNFLLSERIYYNKKLYTGKTFRFRPLLFAWGFSLVHSNKAEQCGSACIYPLPINSTLNARTFRRCQMTIDMVRDTLLWCFIINTGLLLWWFMFFTLAHDWIYKFHGKWFKLTVDKFDAIHYAGMSFFKICIFLFNIVPYFALRIVG